MKIKSLYISAQEKNAGALFVSMGMMEILKRNIHRVAFFRPVIVKKDVIDKDISFILQRYNLDMDYEDAYGFDVEYVETMIASNRINELINELIIKFKKLEKEYDFVLCEGILHSYLIPTINYDLNLKIAQNFGSSYIDIINAKGSNAQEIYEEILIENKNTLNEGCSHFATFVNRLDDEIYDELKDKLSGYKYTTYLFKELDELNRPTIEDVMESLDVTPVLISKDDHTRIIRNIKVAALSLDNFLEHIEEDDFIIVPADRSDIIIGLLGSFYSSEYPNIAGIIFPFNMRPHKNIRKLLKGINSLNAPILSIDGDTYQTANALMKVHAQLRINSTRKIALALGLFHSNVDVQNVEKRILSDIKSEIMTPMMFEYKLFDMANANRKTIVLPESSDERVLRAAEIILRRKIANIILLSDEIKLKNRYLRLGLNLSDATVIDPCKSELMDKFVDTFYELRKSKGLSLEGAKDAMLHVNYFATMMVHLGYADGMVSGAIHSTGDTIRPALQIIKTLPSISIVSSVFFMCLKTKVLVYGDCAVNQSPNSEELAQIALSSANTAKSFGIEPKVAMLSYSTGESGSGADVDKVRKATKIVKQLDPDLPVEGPIQYDAAVNKTVAKTKLPDSKVAGEANVFIFPDLNTGNNTYKAVQRSSNAIAIGPILQGLNKPINDLSRGCLVEDIVNTIAITAIQAGRK